MEKTVRAHTAHMNKLLVAKYMDVVIPVQCLFLPLNKCDYVATGSAYLAIQSVWKHIKSGDCWQLVASSEKNRFKICPLCGSKEQNTQKSLASHITNSHPLTEVKFVINI